MKRISPLEADLFYGLAFKGRFANEPAILVTTGHGVQLTKFLSQKIASQITAKKLLSID